MQYVLMLVVLMFSAAFLLFALPIILYVGPLIVAGILISMVTDRYQSKTVRH